MKLLVLFFLWVCSVESTAELLELQDEVLSQYRGQAAVEIDLKAPRVQGNSPKTSLLDLINSAPPPSSGITLDINLQLQISEIRWVDTDGVGSNGTLGAISMRGFNVGHIESGVLSSIPIRGLTVDVDANKGVVVGDQQIGDQLGNGFDINIDSVQIN